MTHNLNEICMNENCSLKKKNFVILVGVKLWKNVKLWHKSYGPYCVTHLTLASFCTFPVLKTTISTVPADSMTEQLVQAKLTIG